MLFRPLVLAALAAAASASGSGVAPAPNAGLESGRGVIVVAIDGLRADHVGCYGYDRPTTPTIDALAAEGVVFDAAFTASPTLLPAHASLLTGCDPTVARRYMPEEWAAATERRWQIPDSVPHLAVEFLAAGFATAAFVDHPALAAVAGFGPGFRLYVQPEPTATADPARVGAPYLTERLVQWVRSLNQTKPFFAYLHLNDLERAWSSPDWQLESTFRGRPALDEVPPVGSTDSIFFAIPHSRWRGGSFTLGDYEAIYDAHLLRVDEELERLVGSLAVAGRADNTTIVVVGSFGIQFGEAGLYLCGGRFSMADLHVPLVLRPGASVRARMQRPPGFRIDALTSSVDLAPTLLELCGIPLAAGTHGVSLARRIRSRPGAGRFERTFAFASCGTMAGGAVISRRYCLEYTRLADPHLSRAWIGESVVQPSMRSRFYDRVEEPFPPLWRELPRQAPGEFERHRAAALRWNDNMELTRRVLQATSLFAEPVAPEVVARLRALGYLAETP